MNILPPLHIIKSWRDEGLSPAEVYRKCESFTSYRKPKHSPICALCDRPYFAKGLCKRHYDKEWRRRKKLEILKSSATA